MSAAQLVRLVVLRELVTALGASMAAASADCTPVMILIRAGNNAAQSIAFLGEEV